MTTTRTQHLDKLVPEAFGKLLDLDRYVRGVLDPTLLELVLLRASILNGCAYCVDMHTRDALKGGEDARRLFAVSTWHESPFFSPAERAALALADQVTRLGESGVSEEVWAAAHEHFSEKQVADLLIALVLINAFNRLMVATHKQTPAL
ncbi:carboxymuconolactone decarboxylase family protein [Longispora sp. NPDC051575]|uniref:carboxymuconolactone decarboxylase family protein n=1 Tax=Longispora sp. NPDC051575 TaxID=3154943 RepID=UPI003448B594